jgi:hypothetical protein
VFRKCVGVVWLTVVCGVVSANPAPLTHEAAHQNDWDGDGATAQLRLQRLLTEIIETQRQMSGGIRTHPPDHHPPPRLVDPHIGESKAVILTKGGTATVRHTIEWRQYEKDELEVIMTASDTSLVVPDKLVLEFEKHQFRFEYQVKAGEKTGEFTITLTPAAGKPVMVQVIVK